MHITFWLNASSIIKLFSFLPTLGRGFLGWQQILFVVICSQQFSNVIEPGLIFFFFFCKWSESGFVDHGFSVGTTQLCPCCTIAAIGTVTMMPNFIYKTGASLDLAQRPQFTYSWRDTGAFSIKRKYWSSQLSWMKWTVHSNYNDGV